MSDQYIGEIRMFAGNFAPQDWLLCQGQMLDIATYDALFALIGTTYGGDGVNTFALPNLSSRVPVHSGTYQGNTYTLGQTGGTEQVTLLAQQLPTHSHALGTAGSAGGTGTPGGGTVLSDMGPGGTTAPPIYGAYTAGSTATLSAQSILPAGGGLSHSNIQPCLAINFIIATEGVYPSQS